MTPRGKIFHTCNIWIVRKLIAESHIFRMLAYTMRMHRVDIACELQNFLHFGYLNEFVFVQKNKNEFILTDFGAIK